MALKPAHTWGEILRELSVTQPQSGASPHDVVRRKYLGLLHGLTGRNVILYATRFTARDASIPRELLSIADEDQQGFMEAVHGLKGKSLDLILHSPGGDLDAAEAIVDYLRSKFNDMRIIVPQLAQSAATMICCAADTVVMGKHSSLGPIDPQVYVQTALGNFFVPAQAVIDQFDRAKVECRDPKNLPAWMPTLPQYGPHFIQTCEDLISASEELAETWLKKYMFKRLSKAEKHKKASKLSKWLADHRKFRTHGRHISRRELLAHGMKVEALEKNQNLQDLVLAAFHATTHSFDQTPAIKIIENHNGKAFIKSRPMIPVQFQPGFPLIQHPIIPGKPT